MPTPEHRVPRTNQRSPRWMKSTEAMAVGILLLVTVLIGLVNPAFWSPENLSSLARSMS